MRCRCENPRIGVSFDGSIKKKIAGEFKLALTFQQFLWSDR
jgi:hypothetical protein